MKFISLGVVARPFGIRGELRIKPHNPYTTWFDQAAGVWLRKVPAAGPQYYKLKRQRRHQEFFLVTLEGVPDRTAAEALRGHELVAPEDELETLSADEFYWHELVGLQAVSGEGEARGEVIRIEETAPELGGNDLLVVWGEQGEFLVPFCAAAVQEVDRKSGKIVIRPEFLERGKRNEGQGKRNEERGPRLKSLAQFRRE